MWIGMSVAMLFSFLSSASTFPNPPPPPLPPLSGSQLLAEIDGLTDKSEVRGGGAGGGGGMLRCTDSDLLP